MGGHANKESHISDKDYLKIFGLLFAVTFVEYIILKFDLPSGGVLWTLGILSVLKFGYVVAYFMHLRYDNRWLTWMFAAGLVLGILFTTAMYFLRVA